MISIKMIQDELHNQKDDNYAKFHRKLIPNIAPERVIGVRTPVLRKYVKNLMKNDYDEISVFLGTLPHDYYEENQMQAFIISGIKDFDRCIEELEKFLPYVDNWATCDQISPIAFKKEPEKLIPYIDNWIASEDVYAVRFGIGMLMKCFLEEHFKLEYVDKVIKIQSEEYYVNMMIAWYFATALAKQYDAILPYLEQKKLKNWTHNKTIQKAIESYRIKAEQKEYLRSLRQK